jgi:uncharacterized Fe-S cluster-containing radical SAM superfamily protein
VIDPERLLELVLRYAVKTEGGEVYRRYTRFRADRWYGGIATADVVGCNLRCGMCWAWRNTSFVFTAGEWLPPGEVADRLRDIARRRGFDQVRVSGGEPLIAPAHLLKAIDLSAEYTFVVETNGILINRQLAKELAARPNAVVRVSLKGAAAEEFEKNYNVAQRLLPQATRRHPPLGGKRHEALPRRVSSRHVGLLH